MTSSCSRAETRASTHVGCAHARAFGPLLGIALLLSSASGCSFQAHSEWHTGKGGASSSGGEGEAEPEEHEHAHHSQHEGRHSPGGRDNVVRVTGSNKSAGEGGGGDGEEPARTAVHPSGDVPPSSSGSSASSGGSGASGGGGGAEGGGAAASDAASDSTTAAPAQPAQPAADASSDEASSSGKGTLKSPSEPHVTQPSQRKPRKVHRTGDGNTNKEGRRE